MGAAMILAASCSHNKSAESADTTQTDTTAFVRPLHVDGLFLLNDKGDTMVLNGPSLGWHSNWGRFYNDSTVMAFKQRWGANITRAAIGAHDSYDVVNCYDTDSADAMAKLYTVIDAAIANDMYVICDFHSHQNRLGDARRFFTAVTEKYGDTPNILYEIWNEPNEADWDEIKAYANEIVPLIRRKAPNAVCIIGTPNWDQDVDIASQSPLDLDNVLYSLHYYAASHGDDFRAKAETAVANGLPLIISECGSMENTGDGPIGYDSWEKWTAFADRNHLSMLLWDIADKDETCSMVTSDAPSNAMQWEDRHLKEWARLAIKTIKQRNNVAD